MSIRAFVPADANDPQPGAELELDADESRYIIKVRRVHVGEPIELLDGRGGVWAATLIAGGRRARVLLGSPRDAWLTTDPKIVLLGHPDAAATLETLTGASELGASEIVMVRCERSPGHLPSTQRIERVLRAAMRQCGRPSPPKILGGPPDQPWTLADALAHRPELLGLFGQPDLPAPEVGEDAKTTRGARGSSAGVRLLVGPEGGLSPAELDAAHEATFRPVRLGPWVQRTPTAVVAMLARYG